MMLGCLPLFPLNLTYCLGADNNWRLSRWPEEILFEDFQDGWDGCHLGYPNGMVLAILNLHVAPMPPTKFGLNLTHGSAADVVSRVSRWPLRRPSWITKRNDFSNSESLCAPMLPIKFPFNPTYGLGGDVFWRISIWLPWRPSLILEQNNFSNSESLCRSDASYQVLAQLGLRFGRRCCLKNLKMATLAAILDTGMEWL